MAQRITSFIVFVGVFPFALAACGKKENAQAPSLSAPDRESAAPEKVEAQAEVKASSGPVEISMLLYKTEIKSGESLWHQLRIRNVGTQEITVGDQIFNDPWQLKKNIDASRGIYIEVIGPDGKPLVSVLHGDMGGGIIDRPSGMLEMESPADKALVEDWKKSGLSAGEIKRRIVDYNTKRRVAAETSRERPVVKLQPGESVETKSWFRYSDMERIAKRPIPHPHGDFSKLDFYDLYEPGKYKVRAVYNRGVTLELKKAYGNMPIDPWEVVARTEWVQVTVRK